MKHIFIILTISFSSVLLHGYHFAVTDQAIFVPYIMKFMNPSLFPGDILFDQSSAYTSYFYPIIGYLSKIIDIQAIFFIGYLIFHSFFFFGIYNLAKTLTGNKNIAYLSTLPFLMPKFIAGSGIYTLDTFFSYRSVGLVFFLFFLTVIIKNQYYKGSFFAAIAMLFHPLSVIPSLIILPVTIIFNSKKKLQNLINSSLLFAIVSSPLIFLSKTRFLPVLWEHRLDYEWLSVIKLRDEYLFPSNWIIIEWFAILFYLTIIIVLFRKLNLKLRKNILIIIFVTFIVFIFNFILLEIVRTPIVAELQLVRSVSPIAYISLTLTPLLFRSKNNLIKVLAVIIIASLTANHYWLLAISFAIYLILYLFSNEQLKNKIPFNIIFVTIVMVVIIHSLKEFDSYKNLKQKFQIPKPKNEWIDIQIWAKAKTDLTDIFLVLPRQIGFRIFSERPIVPDLKDGAVVMYDPIYAQKWSQSQKDFTNFYNLSETEFKNLKSKYQFKYIVTTNDHFLMLDVAYKNSYFVVYKI